MENTSTTTATDFCTNCMVIIICRVWSFQKKKSTPSVSGGRKHQPYLREHRSMVYTDLVLRGKLYSYLADIDTQAHNMPDLLVTQLTEKEGINEYLKVQDQLAGMGQGYEQYPQPCGGNH